MKHKFHGPPFPGQVLPFQENGVQGVSTGYGNETQGIFPAMGRCKPRHGLWLVRVHNHDFPGFCLKVHVVRKGRGNDAAAFQKFPVRGGCCRKPWSWMGQKFLHHVLLSVLKIRLLISHCPGQEAERIPVALTESCRLQDLVSSTEGAVAISQITV